MTDSKLPELEKTLAAARKAGTPWSPARQQRVSWAVMTSLERARRRRPLAALALAGAAAAAVGVVVWRRTQPEPAAPAAVAVTPGAAGALASSLADGSRIVLDGPATVLRKTVEANDDVLFELEAGGAHFEVARRPSRTFRVHAGPVTVQVIGTGFRVQRGASRCLVAVDHGRVLVSWWGGSRELGAGEQGTFPPEAPAAAAETAPVTAPAGAAAAPAPAPATPVHVAAARAAPRQAAAAAGPDALFARADRARAAGNADEAIAALRELVERHPRDPHAAAAAFTIGRLLLESSRRPREAAAAFAEARALAGGAGPLAEDALAREVEALHAAGDAPAARARAELYRSSFPHGLRWKMVARYGGLQAEP
jgi:TolA-binding protein